MKRKNLHALVVLTTFTLFIACSNDIITDGSSIQKINFSIGFAEDIKTRVATDDLFAATFEEGDTIGIFIYKRNIDEEISISNNELYIDNRKMIYNGSTWQLESPIYYADDDVLLDIYAYFPYQASTAANALNYNATEEMTDLLSASVQGVRKANKQIVPLLFNHLLSMISISIDKTDDIPDFDETFNVYFHGITGGEINLETKELSNAGKEIINMIFVEADNAKRRYCRALVPAQLIESGTVFSFSQTSKGKSISQETAFTNPTNLIQGNVSQFHITLDAQTERDVIYNVYDPYPKYGNYVGMVIETYNDGINGKVISLIDLPDSQWATENYWVDAMDVWDGITNKMKVQGQENWQVVFPAFYQCALYGERWYLPAIEEAYPFLYTNVWTLNEHLLKIDGGQAIDLGRSYFTSTERSQTMVAKIYPWNGSTTDMPKWDVGKVRAFYEF